MEPKQRLFIYDRKEMAVLVLLGVMVALFAFTLGVHLGKRVGPPNLAHVENEAATPVQTEADKLPENPEIAVQASGVPDAVDEGLDKALHDEVAKTGIQLDQARPVDLPKKTKSKNGGATSGAQPAEQGDAKSEVAKHSVTPAIHETAHEPVSGKYTLQVGSHRNKEEAEEQVHLLEEQKLKPFVRAVDLKTKGRWYRVFIGGFETKEEAESAGKRFKAENVVVSFVVAPRPQ